MYRSVPAHWVMQWFQCRSSKDLLYHCAYRVPYFSHYEKHQASSPNLVNPLKLDTMVSFHFNGLSNTRHAVHQYHDKDEPRGPLSHDHTRYSTEFSSSNANIASLSVH